MICTFFGHREVNNRDEIAEKLYKTITNLIENRGVKTFYVGNNGSFDRLVLETLRKLSKIYKIEYTVVLAYLNLNDEYCDYDAKETAYPENLEKTPLRFAIDKRNKWMIGKSDIVVTYVNTCIGGAAKYAEICEKKGMEIIKLGKI
ncbi:MAG: hypothetical protein J6V50_05480 [Clostridia bacterium]|nr:hypothetical protein [Clostridia bacterium]